MAQDRTAGEGSPGMLGGPGQEALPEVGARTAPIGMPTEPEGGQAPGGDVEPRGLTTAPRAHSPETLGSPGGLSSGHTSGDIEPGSHDVPGTPVPGTVRGGITPPRLPDGRRAGEEGARAIERGTGSGVASGGLPAGDAGRYGAPGFAGAHATFTPGVTGARMPRRLEGEPQGIGDLPQDDHDAPGHGRASGETPEHLRKE